MKKFIGLTSPIAVGMWVVIDELKKRGYTYFSLADRVREAAEKQGIEGNRVNWQIVGDCLREEFGAEVLAKQTLNLINQSGAELVIIDSIRHPLEIAFLRENLGDDLFILGVDATVEVRYQLMLERKRGVDVLDWEGFLETHKKDIGIGQDASGQNVSLTLAQSDLLITHSGDLELLMKDLTEQFFEK
jgi:dephospho-CoA kinase